jgi:hypothetical protein
MQRLAALLEFMQSQTFILFYINISLSLLSLISSIIYSHHQDSFEKFLQFKDIDLTNLSKYFY